MRFAQNRLFLGFTAAVALFIVGCGTSTSGNAAAPTDTTVPTATTATTPPTATTAPTSTSTVNTAMVMVGGQNTTVLVDAHGLTLYYRTTDTPTSVYSGGAWPPVLGAPTSAVTLPGKLATLQDANGAQVTYNGHPLYTYAGDSAPGDATGNGVGHVWFVVTPSLK